MLKPLGWLGEEPPGTVQDDNVTAGLVGVVGGAPFCRVHVGTDVARGQVQWIDLSCTSLYRTEMITVTKEDILSDNFQDRKTNSMPVC